MKYLKLFEDFHGYYKGRGYRVDSGYNHPRGTTAADVVRFERDELGNSEFNYLSEEKLKELEKYSARKINWYTTDKSAAVRYVNDSEDEIQEYDIEGEVVAEDGDGGILVLEH